MTAAEKLLQIGMEIGYPFAINSAGYNENNEQGLQAWSCEEDEEGFGVEIFVVPSREFLIDSYDGNYVIFNKVEESTFFNNCEEENEVIYFSK